MSDHGGTEVRDAIVIGTGQAGKPLARALGNAGLETVIVERDRVGGSCINYGCTPTKTMVASARVAHLARSATRWGVHTGETRVELGEVVRRKQQVVESFRDGSRRGLERTEHVELVMGQASFASADVVEVALSGGGTRRFRAPRIFVNTGTRPARPPIDGLDDVPAYDNTTIMDLEQLPRHLLVLGGGYVGLEFGQMFRRFGSRVTLVHRGQRLLEREDDDVSEAILEILREDGLELLLETSARKVERAGKHGLRLAVEGPEGSRTLEATHLLLATGRTPGTDGLNLAAAGVRTDDRGYIRVDERLRTGVDGIWALGDVKGGPAFTHISYDDFRIIRTNLLERGDATTRDRLVPYTLFTDPQLGRVGLNERQAAAAGRPVRVARLSMDNVARAIEAGETRGFMKALVEPDSGRILGCSILGLEGGEVAAVVQTAMMGGLPYTALAEAVFAHPTLAESLNNLFSTLDD